MDKIFLNLVALFNPVFEKAGVNTFQLNEILRVKLMIDNRRPKVMFAGRRQNTATSTKSSTGVTIVTLMLGAFMGALLFVFNKPLVGQTVYFSMFMVMMSLTLITDFTTVLIDVRDQFIIAPRPVDDRTAAIARILHVAIYVLRLALIQTFPAMIMMGFIDGFLAVPLFFVQVIVASMLTIFMVNIIYLLLMKVVSPQRFKDIISYFQIVFSVAIFAAYYLLPKLIKLSVVGQFNLLGHTWAYFIPPVWIASINEVLIHPGRATFITSVMAAAGLTLPLLSIWFVGKVLAPGFNKRLSVIAASDGAAAQSTKAKTVQNRGIIDRVANLIAPKPLENAGFRITWKLSTRIREFKMRVYPLFAYVPIYFIYFALNSKGDNFSDRFVQLQESKYYIFLIYMSTLVLSGILQFIAKSERYRAGWVYYALPVKQPGQIMAGMYKAVICLYFLPYSMVLGIISYFIWGPVVIGNMILAFFMSQIYGLLLALFMVKGLPFSQPVLGKRNGGRVILNLFILGFAALLAYGHYLISGWDTLIWILIIPAILINWLMLKYYAKQSWDNIDELSEMY